MTHISLSLALLVGLASCSEMQIKSAEQIYEYLFLYHTRLNENTGMMEVAEAIDYTNFDLLILGGDLPINTPGIEDLKI